MRRELPLHEHFLPPPSRPILGSYFLCTSVSVTPCSVTLKCTRMGVGRVSSSKVQEMPFRMAGAPVRVSTFTELRYRTLHTARRAQSPAQHGCDTGQTQGWVPGVILQIPHMDPGQVCFDKN